MKKTTSKGRHHKRSVSANIVNYQKDNSIALNQWNNVVRRIDNLKSNINSLIKCKQISNTDRDYPIQVQKYKDNSKRKGHLTQKYCQYCSHLAKQRESKLQRINKSCELCYCKYKDHCNTLSHITPIKTSVQTPINKNQIMFKHLPVNQTKFFNFQNFNQNQQQTVIYRPTSIKLEEQQKYPPPQQQYQYQCHHTENIATQRPKRYNIIDQTQTFVQFKKLKRLQALNQGLVKQNKLLQRKLYQQIKFRKVAQVKLNSTQDFVKKSQISKKIISIKNDKKQPKQRKEIKNNQCRNISNKQKQSIKEAKMQTLKNQSVNISTVKKICQKTSSFFKQAIQPYVNDFNLTMRHDERMNKKRPKPIYPHFKTQDTDFLQNYTQPEDQLFQNSGRDNKNNRNHILNQSVQPFYSRTETLSSKPKTVEFPTKKQWQYPDTSKTNQYIFMDQQQLLLSPQFKKQLSQFGKQEELAYLQKQFQDLLGQVQKQKDLSKKQTIRKKMGVIAETIKQLKASIHKKQNM